MSDAGKLTIFLALAITLAGCKDKDQAFAECQFEVRKMYPGADIGYLTAPMPVRSAMQQCMQVKGFERDASDDACILSHQEIQAACYR